MEGIFADLPPGHLQALPTILAASRQGDEAPWSLPLAGSEEAFHSQHKYDKGHQPDDGDTHVATMLKIRPLTAFPGTRFRFARINTYVNNIGVMIPFSTWALTTRATRLPGASAIPAPTTICSVNRP